MPCGARQRLHQRVGITRHFYAGVYAISVRDLLYAGDKIFFRRIERIIGSQLQRKRPAMLAKVRSYYRIGAAKTQKLRCEQPKQSLSHDHGAFAYLRVKLAHAAQRHRRYYYKRRVKLINVVVFDNGDVGTRHQVVFGVNAVIDEHPVAFFNVFNVITRLNDVPHSAVP